MSRDRLIAQLRALSERELELTLAGLGKSEREQVYASLRAAEQPKQREPSFDALIGLSPWLLKAIDRAKSTGAPSGPRPTGATLAALSEALAKLGVADERHGPTESKPATSFPFMLGRFMRRGRAA